ncbi:MAG: GIY-YIG nuclease family protein [Rhodospirillales bacterium]|nr:GIY-YIG nuclease family protein [Rhodospirillales bacterium]
MDPGSAPGVPGLREEIKVDRRIERVFVYIVMNKRYGTLYTGLTTNLMKRMEEHRAGLADGFTKKHGCDRLMYYEIHDDIDEAAHRERLLKKWHRA